MTSRLRQVYSPKQSVPLNIEGVVTIKMTNADGTIIYVDGKNGRIAQKIQNGVAVFSLPAGLYHISVRGYDDKNFPMASRDINLQKFGRMEIILAIP